MSKTRIRNPMRVSRSLRRSELSREKLRVGLITSRLCLSPFSRCGGNDGGGRKGFEGHAVKNRGEIRARGAPTGERFVAGRFARSYRRNFILARIASRHSKTECNMPANGRELFIATGDRRFVRKRKLNIIDADAVD